MLSYFLKKLAYDINLFYKTYLYTSWLNLKYYLDWLLLSQEFFFMLHKSFLYVGLILLEKIYIYT